MDNKIDKKKIRENVAAFIKQKREERGWTAVQVIDIAANSYKYEIKPPKATLKLLPRARRISNWRAQKSKGASKKMLLLLKRR